ncbi:hypothetical protein CAEBREN_10186 [Caenorhabditis brenneri]|uniref:F-box domain-containing protein n=1 Tax=Caenorhabditis brenneri TaxID=135651 RepID=G0P5T0_CAEBE|nr:hypothetical protein CAEBREN_10186 [Caenorhabditis brenneri]
MTLPILKLPFLVFQMILESMGFIELFIFTRLSNKMKRIVKSRVKVKNFKMRVFFEENFGLRISNENHMEMFVVDVLEKYKPEDDGFPLKLGNADGIISGFYFSEDCEDLFVTFWNDLMAGFREFIDEAMEIFPCPIESITIDNVGQHCEELVRWASSLTIERVSLTGGEFGVRHLQAFNVSSIKLYDASLSDQDIHDFFDALSNGRSNTNMKECQILFVRDDFNLDFIMRGLNVVWEENEDLVWPDNQTIEIYHLTLSNGETGTIKHSIIEVEIPNGPDREYLTFDVEIVRREVNQ